MHVLQRTEELVHNIGLVDVLQYVCSDDSMQICLHIVKDQINVLVILSLQHILQPACIGRLLTFVCLSLIAVHSQYVVV